MSRLSDSPWLKALVLGGSDPRIELVDGRVFPLYRAHGVFWLPFDYVDAVTSPTSTVGAVAESAPSAGPPEQPSDSSPVSRAMLLHRRLGHAPEPILRRLNLIKPGDYIGFCPACATGRSHASAVAKFADRAADRPGALIHTDIAGPMEEPSFTGQRYAIAFTDQHTRYSEVYLLKTKNEALDHLHEYIRDMRVLGVDIGSGTILQADNDTVFLAADFRAFLADRGIRLQTSAPYKPAQNGVAESIWRVCVRNARTLLRDAQLPKPYWGLALRHAFYVRNRTPLAVLDYAVPLTMLTGEVPDYALLRRFGSRAYVHVPSSRRKKWDATSRVGMYAGRSTINKADLVFYPDTRTIVTSADVTFDESSLAIPAGVGGVDDAQQHSTTPANYDFYPAVLETDNSDNPPATDIDEIDGFEFESSTSPALQTIRTYVATVATHGGNAADPASVKHALAGADAEEWAAAIDRECSAIVANETWDLIDLTSIPAGQKVMGSRIVLKTKPDGTRKARLVVQGWNQDPSTYTDSFAPVAYLQSVRVVLAIAASRRMLIETMDVRNAFLSADVDKDNIYLRLPAGWPSDLPGDRAEHACRLKKSLYGIKQAPRIWNDLLNNFMESADMQRIYSDPCVYVNRRHSLIVLVWVDDLILCSDSQDELESFKTAIKRRFPMKELGPLQNCLNMQVSTSGDDGSLTLYQTNYINNMLSTFGMADARPVSTPLPPGTELGAADPVDLLNQNDATTYRSVVGATMYISCATRPDISLAVNQLARHASSPGRDHLAAARHLLRYLAGTPDLGLTFKPNSDNPQLIGYSDATLASDRTSKRSVSGYVFTINGTPVSWKTKLQRTVALSTTESEFQALSDASREAIYLSNMLTELGCLNQKPITIMEDNQPAIHLVTNHAVSPRTRHIAIKFAFVREKAAAGDINVEYCPTSDMVADCLTKALPKPQFCKLRASIVTPVVQSTNGGV